MPEMWPYGHHHNNVNSFLTSNALHLLHVPRISTAIGHRTSTLQHHQYGILFHPTSGNSPLKIPLNGILKPIFSNSHLVTTQHLRLIYELMRYTIVYNIILLYYSYCIIIESAYRTPSVTFLNDANSILLLSDINCKVRKTGSSGYERWNREWRLNVTPEDQEQSFIQNDCFCTSDSFLTSNLSHLSCVSVSKWVGGA